MHDGRDRLELGETSMPSEPLDNPDLEQDSRFPSGPWTGFFLQKFAGPGRHWMELQLTFRDGVIKGEGRDRVGEFLITGRYDIADGKCHWNKRYIGRHDVYYEGFNESKGIWGTWTIPMSTIISNLNRGGFHVWPKAMGDQSTDRLHEEADIPVLVGA
jgi:hypothetical protein